MTAAAILAFIAAVVIMVAAAAPQQRPACPGGGHVAVTGHSRIRIGHTTVRVPDYACVTP